MMHLRHMTLSTLLLLMGVTASVAADDKVFSQQASVQPAVTKDADGAVREVERPESRKPFDFSGGPVPTWVWASGNPQRCWVRHSFESDAQTAHLIATCDNVMSVKLNGQVVAASSEWQQPVQVDVTKQLKSGTNILEADISDQGGARAFIAMLVLADKAGAKTFITTTAEWEFATDAGFENVVPGTVIGKLGDGPWGDVFNNPGGGGNDLLKAAVPRNVFQLLPGFQVEELYTVPKDTQGSWVCLTTDGRGRLIASDQGDKGLYRITPSPIGSDEPTRVEKIPAAITSAQGLLWAFDALYVSANGGPGSGLYRVTDTNNDDQLDHVEKLAVFNGGGEHGPHSLRLSPDGKSIYCIAGNHTDPPQQLDASRIPTNWSEDHLLPRQWDARGHARGRLAPGGWIAKTDPDGKTWELISIGYRNPYDFDITPEGEMFAYDADMEWDMGTPWYRPTRINHVTSGSEFGWRSGTGKWPTYYPDSLPQVVDIGPGSPVGVALGTGAKFPHRYQRALFCCDWTFGTMYVIHLTPQGGSYVGLKDEFVARTPLPLTDVVIGADGAMYFTTGGRNSDSALFRVTYVGDEDTSPAPLADDEFSELRRLRRSIEELHVSGQSSAASVERLLPLLSHADRHIRYAARVALEFQEPQLWQSRVLSDTSPNGLITGCIALAHQGSGELQSRAIESLLALDYAKLSESQQLEFLRSLSLVLIRLGEASTQSRSQISKTLDPFFPSESALVNRELAQVLVYCNSPNVIGKTLKLMAVEAAADSNVAIPDVLTRNSGYGGTVAKMLANMPNLDQIQHTFTLRNMKYGWTLEQRREYLAWFGNARKWSGGASFHGFLDNIQKDFLDNATEAERKALEADIQAVVIREEELPKPIGPGREWSMSELLERTQPGLAGRNFENGRRAYAASRCISCHRYLGDGGSTGPDLTNVAGRFSYKDLLESMIDPSKVISDQYRAHIIETKQGKVINGRVLHNTNGTLTVLTDPVDITKTVEVAEGDIEEMQPSPTSLMPQKLLNPLNEDEVLDLLAYLMSRGNPADPAFAAPKAVSAD